MNVPGVTTSALLDGLSAFFDHTCTVLEDTGNTTGETGQPIEKFTDLAAHIDLPCRVAPVTALSRAARDARGEMVVSTATHIVMLPGAYPSITTAHHVELADGLEYQIVSVIRDSEQLACELFVEKVTAP